jgi:hypothetical protein
MPRKLNPILKKAIEIAKKEHTKNPNGNWIKQYTDAIKKVKKQMKK